MSDDAKKPDIKLVESSPECVFDDIGPNSSNEAARLRARNEELERENRSLERENLALRNQVEELKQRLANATGKAALPADDGLDVPEFLRRTAP